MNRGHYVRPNHTTRTPTSVCFLDCETLPTPHPTRPGVEQHKLRLGVCIHVRLSGDEVVSRRVFHFKTPVQLWRWMRTRLSHHRPLWLYAHNLAFDLTVSDFWQRLSDREYQWIDPRPATRSTKSKDGLRKARKGFCLSDDPPTMLRVFHRDGPALVCCDTLNYWRTSLEKLGKSIGVEKLPMPPWEATDEVWFRYCENDCTVIEQAVLRLMAFVRRNDLGCWKGTLPGLAYSAWRHRFCDVKLLYDGHEQATAISRAGYFGGEGKCWFVGTVRDPIKADLFPSNPFHPCYTPVRDGPVYRLDLTAAYAWAMQKGDLPYKLKGVYDQLPIRTVRRLANRFTLAALVLHAHPLHASPCRVEAKASVARGRDGGSLAFSPPREEARVYYATGRFWTVLVGEELTEAIRAGSVQEVRSVAIYERGDVFGRFVDFFWQLRKDAEKNGDPVSAEFAKCMYTNLSGRFGMRARPWKDCPELAAPQGWGLWMHRDDKAGRTFVRRCIGWLVQEQQEGGETSESLPILPAAICARVRVRMRQLASIAGPENCFYQATDSLHTNKEGYENLKRAGMIRERELGYLQLEGVSEVVVYRGHSNYTADGTHKVAGLKPSAELMPDGTYRQLQFDRLKTLLETEPDGSVGVRFSTFRLSDGGEGGFTLDDGTILPWWIIRDGFTEELRKAAGWEQDGKAVAGEEDTAHP